MTCLRQFVRSGGNAPWTTTAEQLRLREDVAAVRAEFEARGGSFRTSEEPTLRASASTKLAQGAALTRPELAAFLGVSTRKLQRMEASGRLVRCPGLGSVVRYAARDVLRLASAR